MKYLYKYFLSFLLFIIATCSTRVTMAQEKLHPWQLGFGIGYTNYYGDLSNYRIHGAGELYKIYKFADYNSYYQHQPSFSILLQKKITPTLGILFQANYLQFAMSDRYRKNNGSLDTAATNFARSLNFRTTMQDVGLAFTFSPNNGRIGSENAFFYPSFYLGAGVSKFVVKGDLYDANNNAYNYRLPGNINDGSYETNLRDLRTENDSKFRDIEPYVDLGLALNFRISQLLSIALQSDIKYSASDYIDDVSATYKTSYPTAAEGYAAKPGYNVVDPLTRQRGDNNGVNDFYINNRIVLNIALSRKKTSKTFISPVIYSLNPSYYHQKKGPDSIVKKNMVNADSLALAKNDSITKALKDSLLITQLLNKESRLVSDSVVTKRLDSINYELKGIKEILRDQQIKPRLQQLQYQTDSVKNLRARLFNQRPASKENNLMLRVYDLQVDSLRNEYEKAQRRQNQPFSKSDSAILFNRSAVPFNAYRSTEVPDKTTITDNTYDSIRTRYNYLRKMDSIQQRINTLQQTSSSVTNQQIDTISSVGSRYSVDSLNNLKNKVETDRKLLRDEEAATILRQQLKASNDSITYYKKLKETPKVVIKPDSAQKKVRWYQRYLGIGKKKKSVVKSDTVQDVNYARQQEFYESEANLTNRKIDKIENDKTDLALQRINYAQANNQQTDSSEFRRNLNLVQTRIQQNTDSISLLQRKLKNSNDSSAYYQKRLLDASENANAANRKWYQEIFTSERKKQNSIQAESGVRENNIRQQQYYDSDVKNMQNRIAELEKKNSDLQNTYHSYNADRYVRRDNNFPVAPVLVYSGTNNQGNNRAEIDDLRAQLQNMQNELNYDARGKLITDSINALKAIQKDTAQTPAPLPIKTADTTQVSLLRNELNQLRMQLDSLKHKPAPVPVIAQKQIKTEPKYDVTGFPVISVYFKLGSVSLATDQLNKISPFARVASKNTDAGIVLKGFTDPVGSPDKNKIIANKRSGYIKNYLTSKYKIDDTRITIEEPEESQSNTKKANPLDRRVDLQFK